MSIAVTTTFPNNSFEIYGKRMLESYAKYWPAEIPMLASLDDNLLLDQCRKILRTQDAIAIGREKDHQDFIDRNVGKDHPTDYRKQAVRFCHKVFALKRALDAIMSAKAANEGGARYLIWMDADVVTNRPVTLDEVKACLPNEGDAVAYLGRKDWDHSECGWLAFDLEKGGDNIINAVAEIYKTDTLFKSEQWHDSWIWDRAIKMAKATNLTADKPGMDIWPHSPMGKWSTHFKGPAAKADLAQSNLHQQPKPRPGSNIVIQTQNSIPSEEIKNNIRSNQILIKNWLRPCGETDEELVIVSAGPLLIAEDVREEVEAGRKIVAVKHALKPLKEAGIKPWACILLDPRDHVANFVENPDTEVLWFVASQVNPEVTRRLLEAGCEVWGYHAAVGAGEEELTKHQEYSIICGGSATATRGLYMLGHLGFSNFRLYGYDLCYADRPADLKEKDKYGQNKYLDISIGYSHPYYNMKRMFWTEPQLIAQFEEINDMVKSNRFRLKAYGSGMIPYFLKCKETGELREREIKTKLESKKLSHYQHLFECSNLKKTHSSTKRRKLSLRSLLNPLKISN